MPKANWRVIVQGDGTVSMHYGIGVEHQQAAIFEGVWDGLYSEFNFDKSTYVYGSGVKFQENELIFVPPSHSIDCICLLFEKNKKNYFF